MKVLTAGVVASPVKPTPEPLIELESTQTTTQPYSDDDDDDLSTSDGEEKDYLLSRVPYKDNLSSYPSSFNPSSNDTAPDDLYNQHEKDDPSSSNDEQGPNVIWLGICFFGIMLSFVSYGYLLEYATSGGRKLHELSFLFVTSLVYTITAAAGMHVRDEKPSKIPPARFAILGITSMGSTFCSVRSLRYVIFPIQVLAKSCKPVPVMIFGAFLGKKYPLRKYMNVMVIVGGVALFMGGGSKSNKHSSDQEQSSSAQMFGIFLLFLSLCFDGGTGAYEDKLMRKQKVGPFDLMYNIQLGKTIIAFVGLLVLNQVHIFFQMCQDMGFILVALGLTGAMGQVFIFITISKFGALTCSIIGLGRKITTLIVSIYVYKHEVNIVQKTGLLISVGAMVMNFWSKGDGKKKEEEKDGHGQSSFSSEQKQDIEQDAPNHERHAPNHDIELAPVKPITAGRRMNSVVY